MMERLYSVRVRLGVSVCIQAINSIESTLCSVANNQRTIMNDVGQWTNSRKLELTEDETEYLIMDNNTDLRRLNKYR